MSNPGKSGLSDNSIGALAYFTPFPATFFLAIRRYNKRPYVRFHSWQSIFLAVAWFAVWVVLVVIGMIPFVNFLDVILFPVAGIGFLILWVILLINAFNGKRISLPVIGALAAKQSGN